jgi:putative membrane protein
VVFHSIAYFISLKHMLTKPSIRLLPFSLTPSQVALITLWALIMITLPIVDWNFGWDMMVRAIIVGVLVQVSTVLTLLWTTWGLKKTVRVAGMVIFLGWVAEAVGSHTGFPFGGYQYTEALQPQLFHVPLLIPLAWLMMLPPAWAVAKLISSYFVERWQTSVFIGFSALAMTAWDLFLDPQMVNWGLWEWHSPGGYFGIPWSNYLGWLLVSVLITLIIRPRRLPVAPLLLIYTITWLLQTIGLGVFWNMPEPAIVGGIIMGSLTILSWQVYFKNVT